MYIHLLYHSGKSAWEPYSIQFQWLPIIMVGEQPSPQYISALPWRGKALHVLVDLLVEQHNNLAVLTISRCRRICTNQLSSCCHKDREDRTCPWCENTVTSNTALHGGGAHGVDGELSGLRVSADGVSEVLLLETARTLHLSKLRT
ncbi:hypothetical protein AOLI_G00158020 [Acnodon oligacanthus]